MRQITRSIIPAFLRRTSATNGNTRTNGTTLYLHGNAIARHVEGGIEITDCGWCTNTTQERLNGLPGVSVFRKKGSWVLNREPWDGSPTVIPWN